MKRIGRKYATFQEKETLDFWRPRVRCCAIFVMNLAINGNIHHPRFV